MLARVLRDSAVGRALTRAGQRLRTVAAGSLVLTVPRHLWRRLRGDTPPGDESGAQLGARVRANSRVLGAVRHSRLTRALAGIPAVVRRASPDSTLSGLVRSGRQFVTTSWLYRWLTAEPDPDVVVIDLRETLTVGPWLGALERGLRWLLPAAATSLLFGVARRTYRIVRFRPVQLASLALGGLVAVLLLGTALRGAGSPILLGVLVCLAVLAVVGSRLTWTWADLRETRGYQALAAAFEPPEPPESGRETDDDSATSAGSELEDTRRDQLDRGPAQDTDDTEE